MNVETAHDTAAAGIDVIPSGAVLGAEVRSADLRRVDDALFGAIHRAWLDHSVLLFRGQTLSDDELAGFSRRLGDLDLVPVQENGRASVKGHPEIYVVSNVLGADGAPIGSLGAGEAVWHTDMSYLPKPPRRARSMRWKSRRPGAAPGFATCARPMSACQTRCSAGRQGCASSTMAPTTAADSFAQG